jgi:hypothetical protein
MQERLWCSAARAMRGLRHACAVALACAPVLGCCALFPRAPRATTDHTQYAAGAQLKVVLDNRSGHPVSLPARRAIVERYEAGRWLEFPNPADEFTLPGEHVDSVLAIERRMNPCTTYELRLTLPAELPDGSYRVRLDSWLTNVFSVRAATGWPSVEVTQGPSASAAIVQGGDEVTGLSACSR